MKRFMCFLIPVLFFLFSANAFAPVDSAYLLKNTQEKEVYSTRTYQNILKVMDDVDKGFTMNWHREFAVPTSVTGDMVKSGYFIEVLRKRLPEDMRLEKTKENEYSTLYQYYKGMVKVFPGTVKYSENDNKFMAAGSFIFEDRVLNGVSLSVKDAEKIAHEYIGTDIRNQTFETEKLMFDTNKGLKNSYGIKIISEEPEGDFLVVVDAGSGDILYCDNYRQFYSGRAAVYETNPLITGITEVAIDGIQNNGTLYGYYANVKNADAEEAQAYDNVFVYDKDNTHFDEAMVYYHKDLIHDYFKDKFNYTGLDKSMKATVHYGDDYDNAFFSPWGQYFCYGDGNRLNILSREASVIYHEYTHAVSYELAGLGNYGEAGGMNEGFSDYFGNTVTDDPKIGEWVMNKLGKPYMRSCINDSHYPEDYEGECHHDSLMWSAPLWQLRDLCGKKVADALAHYCRYYINYNSTFADGVQAIIRVDEERFGGAHVEDIIRIFAERGITLNDKVFRDRMNEKLMLEEIYGY